MTADRDMKRIAIIGCGLIGGSFALGLKQKGFPGEIIGCDHPDVLEAALRRGAIDRGTEDLGQAVSQAGLVYIATPVNVILNLLPHLATLARPGTLITDAGSTKVEICEMASGTMPEGVVFLGGHPMAGQERGGIENASADLFRGAKYVVVSDGKNLTAETQRAPRKTGGETVDSPVCSAQDDINDLRGEANELSRPVAGATGTPSAEVPPLARHAGGLDSRRGGEAGTGSNAAEKMIGEFLDWVKKLGAEPVWMTAAEHDRAAAWMSHLPQLLSTALAATVAEAQDADGLPVSLAGRGFRDMVRLASSPYEVWRDICLTNKENIARSLSRMEQELARLRENLTHSTSSGQATLEEVFEAGRKVVATLRAEEDGHGQDRQGRG